MKVYKATDKDMKCRGLQYQIGIPVEDALTMASTTPAARVGLSDVGRIAPDMRAHLVAFDEQLHPVMVVIDNDVKCYEGC